MEPSPPDRDLKRWLLIGAGVVLLVIMALNFQSVDVNLIFVTAQMPLFFGLAIAGALGALVGWATPHLRRGRRHPGDEPPKR